MNKYKIAVISSDEIVEEVITEGIKVLNMTSDITNSFKLDYEFFP